MTQTKVATTEQKAVVKYKGEQITISFHDVKTLICPLATDQETVVFLKTCQSLNLNPFANEIYLIKYSENDKAATVIAIESYLKSAESNDNFNGHEAGIVLRDSGGKLEFREGSLLLPDELEKLVGGYARVYRKDREKSFYMAVNKAECLKYTRNGNLTKFWVKDKQPMMLRKTALKRAMVEAFPSLFAGTMSTAEVADVTEAEYREMSEGELPPAMEKEGKPDWKKFWARVKSELGLTTEQARELLQVESIKTELIDTGWTMEGIWGELVSALQRQKATEVKPEQVANETGEAITQEETGAKVKPRQADWRAFWEHAEQLGLSRIQVDELLGVSSVLLDWTDKGRTLDEAIEVISEKLVQQAVGRQDTTQPDEAWEAVTGEGFNIDLPWLKDSQKTLKWSDNTMLSFITSQYKVSGKIVTEALGKLTREQAEDFTKQINTKLEKQKPLF